MGVEQRRRRPGATLATTLEHAAPTRRQWRRWSAWEPVLAGRSYDDVRAELRSRDGAYERNDEVLGALCRIALIDADAMGIITALLLPGLRRRARRRRTVDLEDALSELVTALCHRIKGYDTDRRPRYIASNLLQDAARDARRSTTNPLAGGIRADALIGAGGAAVPSVEESLTASFLLEFAMRAGAISHSEAVLIFLTIFAGAGLRDTAQALGISYEAAKKRRQRILPRLGDWCRDDHAPTAAHRHAKESGP
jgi:DNA-directed RNA polymerase specialized sigma24 family protein